MALIYLLSYTILVLFRFGIFIVPLILTSWPLVGNARCSFRKNDSLLDDDISILGSFPER